MNSFSGDVSRKWTDVARQCRRWCCQFAASNVLSTVRGVACGCWLALHAAAAASATATATSATSAVTSVTSALALHRPDLHDMLSESLGVLRAIACKARPRDLEVIFDFPHPFFQLLFSIGYFYKRFYIRNGAIDLWRTDFLFFLFYLSRKWWSARLKASNLVEFVEESVFLGQFFIFIASSVLHAW